MSRLTVSVQICTYDRPSMALACLDALARQTYPAERFEVVLVDDGSRDPLDASIGGDRYRFPLRLLRVPHGGLARARNAGIRAATGEIVLFLDDDTLADPRLVEEHAASHARHPGSVVLGWVNHVDADRPPSRRRIRLADLSTSFFWTSNASVRREDLVAAGLFDETFVEYGWEDVELGERLRELGLKRRRNGRAIVSHVKRRWRGVDIPALLQQAEASGRSAVVFVRKRPSTRARLTTGLGAARMAANRLLEAGEPWCRARVEAAGARTLRGRDWAAAYALTRIAYFRAVRTALAEPEPGGDREAPAVWRRSGADPAGIHRVVAILTERAGDLLVATPALRNLRTSLPNARVTLLCPPAVAAILRGWDALDEIVAFDACAEPEERFRFVSSLRARRFDLAIALTSNWPAYRLCRALGARTRAGVVYAANIAHSALAPVFLTHPVRVWIFEPPPVGRPLAHRAEELLKVNDLLGLDGRPRPFELPLSPIHRQAARIRLAQARLGNPVVLHLAARWLQDGWTPREVVRIAEALRASGVGPRECAGRVLLTAGPSDQRCAAAFRGDDRFTIFSGLDFHEWAAILEQAAIVVTHDTSAVHVASALGRPVVAVYEARRFDVQSRHWAPWMVPNRVLRKTSAEATAAAIVDATRSLLGEVGALRTGSSTHESGGTSGLQSGNVALA